MHRSLPIPLVCATLALAAACDDSPVGADAFLVAAETAAALQVAAELPTLPLFVEAGGAAGLDSAADLALQRARLLWLEAEAAPDPDAAVLRDAAYDLAVPVLADHLGEAGIARADSAIERWIHTADAAAGALAVAGIAEALARGRLLLEASRTATAAGSPERTIEALLRAGDVLLDTTPRAVARRLTLRAEAGLEGRLALPGARDDAATVRIERLTRGAREAFAAADYPLAIRRAYYAGQLLGR